MVRSRLQREGRRLDRRKKEKEIPERGRRRAEPRPPRSSSGPARALLAPRWALPSPRWALPSRAWALPGRWARPGRPGRSGACGADRRPASSIEAARELRARGCEGSEMVAYGYLPMMVSAQCFRKNTGTCFSAITTGYTPGNRLCSDMEKFCFYRIFIKF